MNHAMAVDTILAHIAIISSIWLKHWFDGRRHNEIRETMNGALDDRIRKIVRESLAEREEP